MARATQPCFSPRHVQLDGTSVGLATRRRPGSWGRPSGVTGSAPNGRKRNRRPGRKIAFKFADSGQAIRYPAIRPRREGRRQLRGTLQEGSFQMLLARRFAAAATALLLIASGSYILLLFAAAQSPAEAASDACGDAAELTVLPSPLAPWKGAPLRVMVVAEKPVEGVLSLIAPGASRPSRP